MPKNYFEGRQECTKYSDGISVGEIVQIITKDKQGSQSKDDLITGKVVRVLSKGGYYRNGIKVEIERVDTRELVIGRCQYWVSEGE